MIKRCDKCRKLRLKKNGSYIFMGKKKGNWICEKCLLEYVKNSLFGVKKE